MNDFLQALNVCGVCKCSPGYQGRKCQCLDGTDPEDLKRQCNVGSRETECSSRGDCHCGECTCSQGEQSAID